MLYKCVCSGQVEYLRTKNIHSTSFLTFSDQANSDGTDTTLRHLLSKVFPNLPYPSTLDLGKRECSSSLLTRERLLASQGRGREDVLTGYSFAWSGINQKEAILKSKNKEGKKRAIETQSQIVFRWNNNGTTQLKQTPVIFPGESR